MEQLKEELKKIAEDFVPVIVEFAERLVNSKYLPQLISAAINVIASIACLYADSKIVHLAKHAKNARIRNKNHKKAMQQGIARYLKEN